VIAPGTPPADGSGPVPADGSAAPPAGSPVGPQVGPQVGSPTASPTASPAKSPVASPATPTQVLDALVAAGATVAVAESLTGGLLTAALTEPAGASNAVRGGVVVYATDLKATLAGVPVPLLDAEGPVSPDVAGALAAGARDRLGATYGLGVTGVAGPDSQGGRPVGTVYVGLAGPGGGTVRSLTLSGDRDAVRAAAVDAALAELLSAVRARSAELPA
jgi:nicotinamide-nucleotide amidase